jgi:hypothetical protein
MAEPTTFTQRDLLKYATMQIVLKRSSAHPLRARFGAWLMVIGGRVSGVGFINLRIEDGYSEDAVTTNPAYWRERAQ